MGTQTSAPSQSSNQDQAIDNRSFDEINHDMMTDANHTHVNNLLKILCHTKCAMCDDFRHHWQQSWAHTPQPVALTEQIKLLYQTIINEHATDSYKSGFNNTDRNAKEHANALRTQLNSALKKIDEVEQELAKAYDTIDNMKDEMGILRSNNSIFMERIRALESAGSPVSHSSLAPRLLNRLNANSRSITPPPTQEAGATLAECLCSAGPSSRS